MSEVKSNAIYLSNGKRLILEPHDGRTLAVDTSSVAFLNIQMDKEGDHVQSISVEDDHVFKIGDEDELHVGNVRTVYKIVYMVAAKQNTVVLLFTSLPNNTTTFLLPMLDKSKERLMFDSYFVNAFLHESEAFLCIMYRFTGTERYKQFEHLVINDPLFVRHEDYDDYHVVYIFKIPENFKEDVQHFKEGRYSQFSKTLRQRILKFYGGEDSAVTMKIIRQDEDYRKNLAEYLKVRPDQITELASKPIFVEEIYRYE